MLKILFPALIYIPIVFLNLNSLAIAEETSSTSKEQVSSAIKAIVQNGVVEYSQGVKRVKIGLEWNPLPETENLIDSLIQYKKAADSLKQIEIKQVSNEKGIICGLEPSKVTYLYEALGLDKSRSCDRLVVDKNLSKNEIEQLFGNGEEGSGEGISPSEYIAMTKERNILRTILQSKGIEHAFNIRRNGELEMPDFSSENITWKVKIYKYIWSSKSSSKNIYYYRFGIKAVVDPFNKNLLNTDDKIKFDARIRIKNLDKQTSIPNNFFSSSKLDGSGLTIISPPDIEKIKTEVNTNFSKLDGIFNFIGRGSQLGTATQGLFGGTENSSFISGGLINFDDGNIDPLLGVNQEIAKIGDVSSGIVFGVGLGQKTSIFLGPSLQYSLFTVSAGATLGAKQKSELGFAGLVSIDLSRLSGNKKEISTISVENPEFGTPKNIREEIEKEIKLNTLMRYRISKESSKDASFELVRVCDETGKPTNSTAQSIQITNSGNNSEGLAYLAKGVYGFRNKNGWSISIKTGSNIQQKLNSESSVNLNENIPQDFTWQIQKPTVKSKNWDNPTIKCPS